MSTPPKRKGKAFWSKVEDAGEAMEYGMRLFLGGLFAVVFSSFAWGLGGQIWVGVGVLCAIVVFPIGFAVGFFWPEVKMLLRLMAGIFFDN